VPWLRGASPRDRQFLHELRNSFNPGTFTSSTVNLRLPAAAGRSSSSATAAA
jgi:mevalonate pyrophosphate decarboxylase